MFLVIIDLRTKSNSALALRGLAFMWFGGLYRVHVLVLFWKCGCVDEGRVFESK